jgi:hypothetical protein
VTRAAVGSACLSGIQSLCASRAPVGASRVWGGPTRHFAPTAREHDAAPIRLVGVVVLSQSNSSPARRGNGVGRGGPARGYSWPPFEKGNSARLVHGMYAQKFSPLDEEEIAETAELLRALLPTYATAFEPAIQLLSARLWRLRRAYRFVQETSEAELPRNFSEKLNSLESLIDRSLRALGLTPSAAAELGVNLARLAAGGEHGPSFD